VVDDLGFKRGFIDARGAGSCHVAGAACYPGVRIVADVECR
jgi:hypothetical protein